MPDYYFAAQRHWDDAMYLHTSGRLPNADQLFGLAAECALKAIMIALGMQMTASGRPADKKHGHINLLWDEFIIFANGKGQAHYALMLGGGNPFSSWDVGQRYESGASTSQLIVDDHKSAAELTYKCLTQAVLDGVV